MFRDCDPAGLLQESLAGHSGDTLGTLLGLSGARGPKGPGDTPSDTPSDTPPFSGDTQGTLRARRARETPVAGRRDRNFGTFLVEIAHRACPITSVISVMQERKRGRTIWKARAPPNTSYSKTLLIGGHKIVSGRSIGNIAVRRGSVKTSSSRILDFSPGK